MMVGKVGRRTFIKATGGLLAFAVVLKRLAIDRIAEASGAQSKREILPEYLAGRVQALTEQGFTADTENGTVDVAFDKKTKIWKKSWGEPLPIELGDEFVAWGQPSTDGTYTPEMIYFNIASAQGKVRSLVMSQEHASFELVGGRANVAVIAEPTAVLASAEGEDYFDPANSPLQDGDFVGIIGLQRDKTLVATRILR